MNMNDNVFVLYTFYFFGTLILLLRRAKHNLNVAIPLV